MPFISKKKKINRDVFIFLGPALALLLFVGIFPFVFNLYLSFSLLKPGVIVPRGFAGISNFISVLIDEDFFNSFRITMVYTIGCVGVELILGVGLALLLNRQIKGKSVIRTLLLLPVMIAPAVSAYIFLYLYNPIYGVVSYYLQLNRSILGSSDLALLGIMAVDIWQWTPFIMLVTLSALQGVPEAPFEAAIVDGASSWQIIRYITLPLIWPVVLIGVLIRIIDAYKVFAYVTIMTEGGPSSTTRLLSYHAYDIMFTNLQWGKGAALSLIILFTIIVICTVYMKLLKVKI